MFRAWLAGLFVLMLSGCSMLTTPARPVAPKVINTVPPQNVSDTVPLVTVKVYTDISQLAGKLFRDLGEIIGDVCQQKNVSRQSPMLIPIAYRRMQNRAVELGANAVLQHGCQINRDTSQCYRQAVCAGSALAIDP